MKCGMWIVLVTRSIRYKPALNFWPRIVFYFTGFITKEYISLAAFYRKLFWHISFFKTVADYISTFCNYLDRFTFVFYIQEVGRLGFRTFSWQGRTTRRLCFWWSRMLASRASRLITTGLGWCGCRRGLGYFWGHTTKEEIEAEEKRRRDGPIMAWQVKNRKNFIASCCYVLHVHRRCASW